MGVVTGIPMEFQFGTNWSAFSKVAGGVHRPDRCDGRASSPSSWSPPSWPRPLRRERSWGPKGHFAATVALFLGTWLSGYFITATNAWMQHPVGHELHDGRFRLVSLGDLLANPWLRWQYPHTMLGSVVTARFVMSSIGAFYLLAGGHEEHARLFVRLGVAAGSRRPPRRLPTGDYQARNVALHQPSRSPPWRAVPTEEARTSPSIGQPDVERMQLDNPIESRAS
jgi:cytochrome d ubiquinol oxidase subunit I